MEHNNNQSDMLAIASEGHPAAILTAIHDFLRLKAKRASYYPLGRYSGKVGNVECFSSVTSLKHKRLYPRDLGCRPFTIQIITPALDLVATYGIATREQVAAHPRCVETIPAESKV